ncbi:nuclear transport factor 2 family protein [Nocardia sp. NEAU-G5]|uniref:Nuclear transport factor 2 family protein n=1 Tax=Nocardia albiluteola TaxID=2842303 RepID=A0ABS6AYF9_9NOCA|nr:nuclear transport factor 2 family protein [Nocardia albiluteola]MBU3062246.1 nuclear transport factor 2 family protein [Nocardia albiluteola]
MTEHDNLVTEYLQTWNETDAVVRRAAIDELWAADCTYTDPIGVAEGRDAIDATIAAVQGQFAGLEFSLGGPVDAHHNIVRFTWNLGPAGGEALVVGFDVAVLDEHGQISKVHGFLDKVPA